MFPKTCATRNPDDDESLLAAAPARPLLLFGALALYAAPLPAEAPVSAEQRAANSEARLKKDIYFLASDECEGRGPTTKGINLAADYIADQFKNAGLKPGGVEPT